MKTTKNTIPVLTLKKVVSLRKVLLAVYFPYKTKIKELIKSLGGYYFSNTLKAWYILHRRNNLMTLKKTRDCKKKVLKNSEIFRRRIKKLSNHT